jgi:hypothetical protein
MSNLDLSNDVIDLRDLIERFEEIEADLLACFNEQQEIEGDDTCTDDPEDSAFLEWAKVTAHDDAEEFNQLLAILDELKGCGGDEQFRGDWYPITLISESYFTDYCMELVQDIGDLPRDIPSYLAIDWEATADNLKVDYSEIEIDSNTYYFR